MTPVSRTDLMFDLQLISAGAQAAPPRGMLAIGGTADPAGRASVHLMLVQHRATPRSTAGKAARRITRRLSVIS